MCPTEPQTLDQNRFPSVLLWWTMHTSSYFLLIYIFPIYALQKQTNLQVLQARKRKVFLRRNFIRKQSGTWRSADTKTLDAARRTEEQKQESSFALFRVPGYLISRLSFSVNVLYSKSTLDAEGKQDLKRSTNMETGTLSTRVETYGQDGKYNYSF